MQLIEVTADAADDLLQIKICGRASQNNFAHRKIDKVQRLEKEKGYESFSRKQGSRSERQTAPSARCTTTPKTLSRQDPI